MGLSTEASKEERGLAAARGPSKERQGPEPEQEPLAPALEEPASENQPLEELALEKRPRKDFVAQMSAPIRLPEPR